MAGGTMTWLACCLGSVLALLPPGNARVGAPGQTAADAAAVNRFEQNVEQYATLHRRAAQNVPPIEVSADPAQIKQAIQMLASAIRAGRPRAAAGDFFDAGVGAHIRTRIHDTLTARAIDVTALLMEINEDGPPNADVPEVNGPFPWARGSMMPATMIEILPPLPAELEYRFVDRDLVLVDVDAGLVVDVLRRAIDGR